MSTPQTPIAGAWKIVIQQRYLGETIYNSLGWLGAVGRTPTLADANALAQEAVTNWAGQIMPNLHEALDLVDVTVYSLANTQIGATRPVGNAVTGGQTTGNVGQAITGALCANVQLSTGLRGRRFVGRTGLAGLGEIMVEGNTLTESARITLEGSFDTFRANMATVQDSDMSGSLAVVSHTFSQATPVIDSTVKAKLGTRVSRLR